MTTVNVSFAETVSAVGNAAKSSFAMDLVRLNLILINSVVVNINQNMFSPKMNTSAMPVGAM